MYLYPVITIFSNIVYVKLDIKSQLFRSELVNHVVFLKVYNILIKMLCFIVNACTCLSPHSIVFLVSKLHVCFCYVSVLIDKN